MLRHGFDGSSSIFVALGVVDEIAFIEETLPTISPTVRNVGGHVCSDKENVKNPSAFFDN